VELSWTPYAILPLAAAGMAVGLSLHIVRHEVTRAGGWVVATLVSVAVWTLCGFLDHLVADYATKLVINQLMWLGVATVGPFALCASICVAGHGDKLGGLRLAAVFVPPAAFLAVAWTNDLHHLFWVRRWVALDGPFPALLSEYGPVFWAQVAFSYTCIGLAGLFGSVHFIRQWRFHSRAAPLLVAAIAIPALSNVLFLSGQSPIPNADITGYSMALAMVLVGAALLSNGALEISRIAPGAVLQQMRDGVVIVDAGGHVTYVNQRAASMLALADTVLPTRHEELLEGHPALLELLRSNGSRHAPMLHEQHVYQLSLSIVGDRAGAPTTRVVSIQDVTHLRDSEQRILQLAYFDVLTGLPNRAHFHQMLEAEIERATRELDGAALFFLDLDRFKQVNDTLGHGAGDDLLRQVSRRLEEVASGFSEQIDIARIGGDEFTLLVSGQREAGGATSIAEQILESLSSPFRVFGREIFSNASIGIAFHPDDGESADKLMLSADSAMYEAKRSGRSTHRFYTPDLNDEAARRLELEGRLHHAMERGELALAFQPVCDTRSGTIEAAEVLLRWQDPKWGNIPPNEFIPIAEETGLIAAIGEWTLDQACAELRRWQDAGHLPIRLMVNLSSHHLRRPGLIEAIRSALEANRIAPNLLELEITESTIMHEDAVTVAALRALDEKGVGLALDDFGTGYSSLSNLRRFPFSRLKIDRSFIAGLPDSADDVAIVEAILAMARSLRLDVVAEGVETEEQMHYLTEHGCSALQGYLIGKPMSANDFRKLLAEDEKLREPDQRSSPSNLASD
jgi:diguanylate cyclase (GGDEF)-like protein